MGRLAEGKTLDHLPALRQVRPWHRQLARVVAAGMRPGEISAAFGYTPATVSKILASPLFQAEVARIEAGAEAEITSVVRDLHLMSSRAAEVLDEALDADVSNWQERARRTEVAFGVLDRAGYGRTSKLIHMEDPEKEESDEAKKAFLRELGKQVAQKVIKGEFNPEGGNDTAAE